MARTTLYKKLSKREDFKKILKRINLVGDPIKYVRDSFNVGHQTAKRFLNEMNGVGASASVSVASESNTQVDMYLERFNQYVEEDPSTGIIIKIRNQLEDLSKPTLKCFFKRLYKVDVKLTDVKYDLVQGVAYQLQHKYYEKVYHRKMNEAVEKATKEAIRKCINFQQTT